MTLPSFSSLNPTTWLISLLGVAALVGGFYVWAHHNGYEACKKEWDASISVAAQQKVQADAQAKTTEEAWQAQANSAISERMQADAQLQTTSRKLDSANVGLRNALNALRDGLPQGACYAANSAYARAAASLSACSTEYSAVAKQLDGEWQNTETLSKAWPE